ncbi:hypothetical protein A1O7_08140 [Cladophialophora yegresii CBS 114405]|uniref:Uncharacterized protein n=1 Tax=Cladophialophora yegresii CBS 114405 TaxID=1182544 RepID=W9W9I0_9EURO|nr:uncharacterized protein A1O7_08140 [Cladophialophora yegresii CBS 114405]EXJ55214.1 hypothetical protein A1O7_08140 [Cladophialophora yegresii CBS 114405]
MDQAADPRQVRRKAKFIHQDPTSSQYNGRISSDDKRTLATLLPTLHERGVNRETMLAECNAVLGTPITFAQLDRQRAKFNLHTYRKQRLGPLPQTQFPNIIAPSVPPSSNEERLERNEPGSDSETLSAYPANQLQHRAAQDAQQLDGEVSFSGMDLLNDSCDDYDDVAPQREFITDLVSIDMGNSAMLGIRGVSPKPSPSDAGPLYYTNTANSSHSDMYGRPAPPRLGLWFVARAPHTWLHQELVYYVQSQLLVRIYLRLLGQGATATAIAQLFQIGTLLRIVRAFDQAFDLFLILFRHFYICKSINARSTHMTFAALGCAHTARSILKVRVASCMVQHVRRSAPYPTFPPAYGICCTVASLEWAIISEPDLPMFRPPSHQGLQQGTF